VGFAVFRIYVGTGRCLLDVAAVCILHDRSDVRLIDLKEKVHDLSDGELRELLDIYKWYDSEPDNGAWQKKREVVESEMALRDTTS
jgi:hypothetical protein